MLDVISYIKTWWAARQSHAPAAHLNAVASAEGHSSVPAESAPEEHVQGAVVQVIMVFDTPLPDSVAAQVCQARGAQIEELLQDTPHLTLPDPRLDNRRLSMRTVLYARALSDAEVHEFHERRKK